MIRFVYLKFEIFTLTTIFSLRSSSDGQGSYISTEECLNTFVDLIRAGINEISPATGALSKVKNQHSLENHARSRHLVRKTTAKASWMSIDL